MSDDNGYKNEVFVNDRGEIEAKYLGHQTVKVIRRTTNEIKSFVHSEFKDGPIKLLVDTTKLSKTDSDARKEAVKAFEEIKIQKAAVYGSNFITKTIVNLIIAASGKYSVMRYFSKRKEAEKWLSE